MIYQYKGRIAAAIVGLCAIASIAACGQTHTDAPEPTSSSVVDGTRTQVIRMSNGFRNVEFTCYGHNGVYVTSRGANTDVTTSSSVFVVPNDEHCK
jgi:hypothetical protein